jgi:hypothetical protein
MPRLSLPRLWAFLAIALPVLGTLIAGLSAVDLAYNIRAGDEILAARALPSVDTWTFTAAGSAWLDQQWGAQAVLAAAYGLAGWTGLVLLRVALIAAMFAAVFGAARAAGLDLRRAAWLTLASFAVVAGALALRPQLFGMTLFALVLWIVARRRSNPGRVWLVPLIVAVWANLHGSFFLGPVLLGLAWLQDLEQRVPDRHRMLRIAAVSIAASLANPFGLEVWRYAVGLSTNAFVTSRITEWQPTSLRSVDGALFFGSLALVGLLIARRGRPVAWSSLLSLAIFAAIGVYAIRGIAWWGLAGSVAAAALLAGQPDGGGSERGPEDANERPTRRSDRPTALNTIVAVVIALACVALLPAWRPVDPRVGAPRNLVTDAPPGVTAALAAAVAPGTRVLNPQPWGSWFELAVPAAAMAIDSRIEVFPASVWAAYERVRAGGDGWQETLASWAVDLVVVGHAETALRDRLVQAGWTVTFEDDDGAILRSPGAGS